jgi:hypothetical protein
VIREEKEPVRLRNTEQVERKKVTDSVTDLRSDEEFEESEGDVMG